MNHLETAVQETVPVVSLEERRDTLYARLDSGFTTLEAAAQRGDDTARWEQGWQRLLREYEAICDQIARRNVPVASR